MSDVQMTGLGLQVTLLGALFVAVASCGRPAIAGGDGLANIDGGGLPGTDAPAADASGAAALCASPLACSEDPAAGPAGTCHVVPPPSGATGAPADWSCDCAAGFSSNPKSRLCRAGDSCSAAAADEWPNRMALDTGNCASRAPLTCPATTADSAADAKNALESLAQQKCVLPGYLTVRVEIVGGCASLIESRWHIPGQDAETAAQFLTCFASALADVRIPCAGATTCAMFEYNTLP